MKEPLKELNFVYALAEHCNLNCAGCDHFAPIAEPEFSDYAEFERDFKRLSEILERKCRRIGLMGGEPLLCPNIEKFLHTARDSFPNTQISIVTNGLLLNQMSEEFYDSCKQYNIEIEYTKYPIAFDYESVHKKLAEKGLKISAYANTAETEKVLYFIPMDIDGKQDAEWNFNHCFHANNCIQLKHGRLYTCTIAPNIVHFNKAFHTELDSSKENGIDIYQNGVSEDDIKQFLARPIPMCQFCDVRNRRYEIPWKQSEKSIFEWSLENKE